MQSCELCKSNIPTTDTVFIKKDMNLCKKCFDKLSRRKTYKKPIVATISGPKMQIDW